MRRLGIWMATGCLLAALSAGAPAHADAYEKGVAAYACGDYAHTVDIFDKLSRKHPENARYAYFLGIASAQLGRISEARAAYEAVLRLSPEGPEADLAREGLQYLPALALQMAGGSDVKPEPEPAIELRSAPRNVNPSLPAYQATQTSQPAPNALPASASASPAENVASSPVAAAQPTAAPAWTPQDAMAMQMLMGGMNGANGAQPWMTPAMTPGAAPGQAAAPGQPTFDPAMFNAMMMSQMMGSMDMMGSSNNERDR